jgi:hypothetical protein
VDACDHAYKFDQNLVALRFELGSVGSSKQQGKRSWGGAQTQSQQHQQVAQKQTKSSKRSKRGGQRKDAGRRADDNADDDEQTEEDGTTAIVVAGGDGAGWVDRPKFSGKGWKQLQAAAKKKYPRHCMFYLLGTCTRGDGCKFQHNTPADFADWKSKMCDECEQADQ